MPESLEEQLELANSSLLHANMLVIELESKLKIAVEVLQKIKLSSCCNVCECLACLAKETLEKIDRE